MDANQAKRISRALEVLNDERGPGPRDTADIIYDLAGQVGKLQYWLRDIIALAAELDGQPAPAPAVPVFGPGWASSETGERLLAPVNDPADLASCGHPRDEDGECSCASWPERAPAPVPQTPLAAVEIYQPSGLTPPAQRSIAAPRTEAGPCFGEDCDHVSHQWSTPPELDGYAYKLPEDYLRGGAQ
jgi:hypothetical protein